MNKGPVSQFVAHHYRHFNAAAMVDAAKAMKPIWLKMEG